MALGLFLEGVDTEESCLAIRADAFTLLAGGATVMTYTVEGTTVGKQITMPIRTVIEECNWFLRKINPAQYGTTVKRTVPRYTYS